MKIRFWAAILVSIFVPALTQAQTAEEIAAKQTALEERARESVATLQALIEARAALRAELADLSAAAETANEVDKKQALAELEARRLQLTEIEDQISVLATGIAESDFDRREPTAFDLQSELEALVQQVTAGSQVQSAAKGFFRERGLSLLLGVTAFIAVLMILRMVRQLVRRVARSRGIVLGL